MKISRSVQAILLLAIGLCAADPAMALRCKGKLVSDGSPQSKVARYCGEPTAVQVRTIVRSGFPRIRHSVLSRRSVHREETIFANRIYEEVLIEEWTYNFGPRKLMRLIRFENGLVVSVKQLGYGYHD